jgi:polar amino acid transport system substrate-binding protein
MMKKYLSRLLVGVTALVADSGQAGAIDDAVKRGTLKVGMDPTYMPFEMTNKRGEIIGFEVDILKAMAKSMGVKLELVSTGYDGIIPALLTDKFDMIGSGMTLTQERNLRLNFSEPFIVVGQTLLIRKELEGTIKSYKDLNNEKYRITSKLGTTGEMVAKKLIAKAKYHGYDNEQEAVLDVVNGKADAFIYDAPYNVVAVNKVGAGKLVFLEEPFTYEPLAFGLKKGDYDSINFINNFLHQIKKTAPTIVSMTSGSRAPSGSRTWNKAQAKPGFMTPTQANPARSRYGSTRDQTQSPMALARADRAGPGRPGGRLYTPPR